MSKYKEGYTLLELIIVIGAIFILMGVLAPILFPIFTQSKEVRLKEDTDTLEFALTRFYADVGQFPKDDSPPPTTVCGEEADIDLIGDKPIVNENSPEDDTGLDSGLVYNGANLKRWNGAYLKKEPRTSVIGGSIYYHVFDYGNFSKANRKDVALEFTICNKSTESPASIFEDMDRRYDDGKANSGLIFVKNAADQNDFGAGNLIVILFPDSA